MRYPADTPAASLGLWLSHLIVGAAGGVAQLACNPTPSDGRNHAITSRLHGEIHRSRGKTAARGVLCVERQGSMKAMRHIVLSSVMCGVFTVGCVGSPATEEAPVGQTEQDLGATTQAQEREVTYFSEPEKINEVGFCSGPFRCFGPKGLVCSGQKTPWFTVEFFDCGL